MDDTVFNRSAETVFQQERKTNKIEKQVNETLLPTKQISE